MARKKLIFFVATDPGVEPAPVTTAYRLASAAASADVQAEVRLAGDAVLVADPAYVATVDGSEALRARIDGAASEGIEVSVCPRSVLERGIREDQAVAIGARARPLTEILVEVAEGDSVLVHL